MNKPDDKLLEDIFRAYYDARRNKRNSKSQLRFELNLEENLIELYNEINQRNYQVGRSICFITFVPVKREVFAADFRDRVVHHLLYNYISPLFERTFIEDCYSCRKGKGTLYGIERCEHHIKSCSDNYRYNCYVLKLDIRGYFMHINRKKLYEIVMVSLNLYACRVAVPGKRWKDLLNYELVGFLIKEVIFNDPTQGCEMRGKKEDWNGLPHSKSMFYSEEGCGLPIGNLTSQLFSNIYLTKLDNYVKRILKEKHYGRYVDDFYIVHTDKQHLTALIPQIRHFLQEELGLELHPDKICLQCAGNGMPFLGTVLKPYRIYMKNNSKKRMWKHLMEMKQGMHTMPLHTWQATLNSYQGYMTHLKCFRLMNRIKNIKNMPMM